MRGREIINHGSPSRLISAEMWLIIFSEKKLLENFLIIRRSRRGPLIVFGRETKNESKDFSGRCLYGQTIQRKSGRSLFNGESSIRFLDARYGDGDESI